MKKKVENIQLTILSDPYIFSNCSAISCVPSGLPSSMMIISKLFPLKRKLFLNEQMENPISPPMSFWKHKARIQNYFLIIRGTRYSHSCSCKTILIATKRDSTSSFHDSGRNCFTARCGNTNPQPDPGVQFWPQDCESWKAKAASALPPAHALQGPGQNGPQQFRFPN